MEPSSKSMFFIILGIFGVIIVLVGAIILFAVTKPQPTEITAVPTQQITSAPTPTSDPYAGWQTYTNSDVHFAIQIPQSWKTLEQKNAAKKTTGVTLTGAEGTITITWATGQPTVSCLSQVNSQVYNNTSQGLNGCSYLDKNNLPSWFLGKNITPTQQFQIQATSTSQNNLDKQVIKNILLSIKFT